MTLNGRAARGPMQKLPPELWDITNWPTADESLSKDNNKTSRDARERLRGLTSGVVLRLDGGAIEASAKLAGLSKRQFQRCLKRACETAPDGRIWGLRAFLKGVARKPRERQAPLGQFEDSRLGYAGIFRKMMREFPDLEAEVINFVLDRHPQDCPRPNRVGARQIWNLIRAHRRANDCADDEYPLKTASIPYAAIEAWISEAVIPRWTDTYFRQKYGPQAAQRMAYQAGDGQAKRQTPPYAIWQIDETTVDVQCKQTVVDDSGDWSETVLPRTVLVRITDEGTNAVVIDCPVTGEQVTKEDILAAFWFAMNPEPPSEFTVSASLAGAGYPAEVPDFRWAVPAVIELDNALAHLANSVLHGICDTIGARLVLGRPKTPQQRNSVESSFGQLSTYLLHECPGTTARGPGDPLREIAKTDVTELLHYTHVRDALCAQGRSRNASPSAKCNSETPLAYLARRHRNQSLVLNYLPPEKRHKHLLGEAVRRPVKCPQQREPEIHFAYARYQATWLKNPLAWKKRAVWIRCDFDDLQTIWAYDENGAEIGPLYATGKWGRGPSNMRIRKLHDQRRKQGLLGPTAEECALHALFMSLKLSAPTNASAALQLKYLTDYLEHHLPKANALLTNAQLEIAKRWDDERPLRNAGTTSEPMRRRAPEPTVTASSKHSTSVTPLRHMATRTAPPKRPYFR